MFKFTILNHLIQKSSKILKYKANLFTILHCLKEQLRSTFFSKKGFKILVSLTLSKTLIIAREFSRRIATNSLTRCQRKRKLRQQVSRKSTLPNEASSNLGTQEDHTYICTRQTLLILSENLSLYKFSLYNQNLHLSQAVTFFLFITVTIEGFSAKERYATMIILKDIKIL